MRKCSKCNILKELEFFIKNKTCKDGRSFTCKSCQNSYSQKWKQKNSIRLAERRRELYYTTYWYSSKQKILERQRIREQNKPYYSRASIMRCSLLQRKKIGIIVDVNLFTIKYITDWLKNQLFCKCCGVKFDVGFKHDKKPHNNSPSLDRFVPERGYVKGNVSLVCWRCNNLKRDATSFELRRIADWMDVWGNDEKLQLQPLEVFNEIPNSTPLIKQEMEVN